MERVTRWFQRLFRRGVRVVPDGKGYRVDDEWYPTQVEVRRRLEELGLDETEILRILKRLNIEKYGDAHR
ncbi:MAG: hypothetical protein ACOY94_21415 [Bacillota bacterium]